MCTSVPLAAAMIAAFALITAWSISLLPRTIDVRPTPVWSSSMLLRASYEIDGHHDDRNAARADHRLQDHYFDREQRPPALPCAAGFFSGIFWRKHQCPKNLVPTFLRSEQIRQ